VAEDNVPGGPPVDGVAAVATPRWPWVVLFAVLGAAWCAYVWATAAPAKPLATFLMDQARGFGMFLLLCGLAGAMANRRRPFEALRLPLSLEKPALRLENPECLSTRRLVNNRQVFPQTKPSVAALVCNNLARAPTSIETRPGSAFRRAARRSHL
jgi:hypothetical protein